MPASILCLVENHAPPGLRAEHGLSFLVRTPERSLLFDTGQTPEVLAHNARALSVSLDAVDAVVLSHGHYDHTGGLPAVLGERPVEVFAHPEVLRPRWGVRRQERRYLGPPWTAEELGAQVRWRLSAEPVEVAPDVWTTGEIPRLHPGEAVESRLVVVEEGEDVPDRFPDDQALVLLDGDGLVVVLGCCHAGLVNTLDHVIRTWQRPVRAVLGGSHLAPLDPELARHAATWLQGLGPVELRLGHCTGSAPLASLRQVHGSRVEPLSVGLTW